MGKKVNPKIIRLNTTTTHLSKWFAPKQQFAQVLQQDVMMRKFLKVTLRESGVSRIEIRRSSEQINILIRTSKPGMIIGRNGSGVEELKRKLKKKFFGSHKMVLSIEIEEVRQPDLDAELVMQGVINQLEKRIPFRRAMKRAIEQVIGAGAKGVKIICSGRLNGVEIARTETLGEGSVPTHTLRADIDYTRGAAQTLYGKIGVKVWIYRGQVFGGAKPTEAPRLRERSNSQKYNDRSRRSGGSSGANSVKRTVVKSQSKPQSNTTSKSA